MDRIVIFEGPKLKDFLERLRDIVQDSDDPFRGVYRIRVALDSEGLRLKVDDQSWLPPLGCVHNVEFEPPEPPRLVDPLNLMARYGKRSS